MSQKNDNGFATFESAEAITQYARVKLNSSRKLLEADADDKGIGTAQEGVASGINCTVKLWSAPGTHKMIANGAFTTNDVVYSHDEGEIDDDPAVGVAVGRALETPTANGDIVEVMPFHSEGTGLIYSNQADSASVTNTTTETAFDKSYTIDGGSLQIGDVIEVIARAHCVATNSTDTLNLKLYFGTEEIAATGAVDVADNDVGFIHAWITIRSLGASGTISATAETALGVSNTVTSKPKRMNQATEDISGDVAITVKATWSVASASNDVILEDMLVILHRK